MISVILPFHLNENQKYLDLCLESLLRQEGPEFEIILNSSAQEKPQVPNDSRIKLLHEPRKSQYATKINEGVRASNPNTKYLMLASDDVIFGKHALANLSITCHDNSIILNAYSNCDLGWLYFGRMQAGPLELKKYMSYEEVKGFEEHLYNFNVGLGLAIPTPHNCFYATMIPRKVWNMVGELDENYKTGWEDTDYCLRAHKLGVMTMATLSAFIFHFGGKTSGVTVTEEEKRHNESYFQKRWRQS